MITLEQLRDILNQQFGEPFLVSGGVTAEIVDDDHDGRLLSITIGRRDIQIDMHGEVVSSGTFMMMGKDALVSDAER